MEKEIVNQILKVIQQSGNYQLLILAVMFCVMLLVNILQAIYTSKTVDRYKNELKKKETRFTLYNQMQVEKLSEMFELAHELKSSAASIHGRINESVNLLKDDYNLKINHENLDNHYSKHRYILPKKIRSHFKNNSTLLSDFKCNVNLLSHKNIMVSTEINDRQNDYEDCIELIDNEIKDYNFNKTSLEVMLFCEQLKVLIEEYFDGTQEA